LRLAAIAGTGRGGRRGGLGTSGAAGVEAGPGDGGRVHWNPQPSAALGLSPARRTGILTSGVVRELVEHGRPVYAMQSFGRPVLAQPPGERAAHMHTLLAIQELATKVRGVAGQRQSQAVALKAALDRPPLYRSPLMGPVPAPLGPQSRLSRSGDEGPGGLY
jgi:hypothetical protein